MKSNLLLAAGLFSVLGGCSAFQPKTAPEITPVNRISDANSVARADRLLERGNHERALAAYRAILTDNPENAEARYGLAEALRKGGDPEASKAEYVKIADDADFRARALEGLGHASLVTGDHHGAFESFSSAVNDDIGAWRAWLGLAQLRDLARDWENADEAYSAALTVSDNPALVHNNHGVSMLARGKAADAVLLFKKALDLDSKLDRAATNLELANASVAGASLEQMAAAEPDARKRAQKLNNYGYVAMLQGRHAEAEKLFQAAIEAHPAFYVVAFENLKVLKTLQSDGKKPAK